MTEESGVACMNITLELENEIGTLLVERRQTVSVAESCTGGMLGSRITSVSGSSAYFLGGVIAYANAAKVRDLGVDAEILKRDGAVSDAVSRAMATNVRLKYGSDYGISITGIAGPEGAGDEKSVGLVYVGVADDQICTVNEFRFEGDRQSVRRSSCVQAFEMLKRAITAR